MADDAAGAVRRTPRPARDELIDRALIRRAIADPGAVVAARWPEESGPEWSARAVEQTLLAAGWQRRPVVLLRADDCDCGPPYADCMHGPEPVDALDLAVWLHAEQTWRVGGLVEQVNTLGDERDDIFAELVEQTRQAEQLVHGLAAERDALQARLDAALAACDGGSEFGLTKPGALHAVRAALQGDQPAADQRHSWIPPDDPCQDFRCSRIDGRCVGMHCARCGEPCGAQGHTCSTDVGEPTGEVDRG